MNLSGSLPLSDVVGQDWLSFELPECHVALHRAFDHVIATGEDATVEGPGRGPGAARPFYVRRLRALRSNGVTTGVVMVARDVTQDRRAEEKLMVADRMAAIGTLVAGVAHEINNPLGALIANLEMAAQDHECMSEQIKAVRDAKESVSDGQ